MFRATATRFVRVSLLACRPEIAGARASAAMERYGGRWLLMQSLHANIVPNRCVQLVRGARIYILWRGQAVSGVAAESAVSGKCCRMEVLRWPAVDLDRVR